MLIAVLLFAGCSKTATPTQSITTSTPPLTTSSTSSVAAGPIKIGIITELTGAFSQVGTIAKMGVDYALERRNGKIGGRDVQLIYEDDASNPTTAVDKAKKLVLSDKVDLILGPVMSPLCAAAGNFIQSTGIPEIFFTEQGKGVLIPGSTNLFCPMGTQDGSSYYLGQYATKKLGYKTATAIYVDDALAIAFVAECKKAFEQNGGSFIQSQAIPINTMDYSPQLATLKQADCVVTFQATPDTARFVSQYRDAGFKMPILMTNNAPLNPKVMSDIGDKSLDIVAAGKYADTIDSPANNKYVGGFIQKYQMGPTSEAATADIAFDLYEAALRETNGDTSPAKIIAALNKVKVDTIAGTVSIAPDGIGIGDLYIMKTAKIQDRYDWTIIDSYSQIKIAPPN